MKEIEEEVFGKQFTFKRLNMASRAVFQKKIAGLIGGNFSLDGQVPAAILSAIGNAEPELLAEIAKTSIVGPPSLGSAAKAEDFFEAIDKWEEESGEDGLAILWALVTKSLEIQFGGIVETLGKKLGINVPKISDILDKAKTN